jgi:hypothetical protein
MCKRAVGDGNYCGDGGRFAASPDIRDVGPIRNTALRYASGKQRPDGQGE